ncbi:hypothetical protein SERLADRAFT_479993 [Serpula lacrymans var. lacrymans S7.9]|nr:uncharacterized protein SERLADRAFT_479993 [Serpula lacrymans var. lacrymans S7.9]EGO18935.1 hypothetical protein SERLADRAFT_479993 [Serpula lacrymans var. lacrymans S7.9]
MAALTNSLTFVSQLQITNYFNVACLVFWILDYCISFELEVRWVWGRKCDLARFVFTFSRYLPFINVVMTIYGAYLAAAVFSSLMVDTRRQPLYRTQTETVLPTTMVGIVGYLSSSIIAPEGLLVLRTYAFWEQSKKILAWLLVSGVVCLAVAFTLTSVIPNSLRSSTAKKCFFINYKTIAIQYAFIMLYECLLLSLTAYKTAKHYRVSKNVLVFVVYRDSMIYMGCIIVVSLVNAIGIATLPLGYSRLFFSLQFSMHSILASRILFNLRESDARLHNVDNSLC